MIPAKLRSAAAGAAVGLILALGFYDSLGLWPLRLIAAWPAEVGRALGNLFTAGRFAPLALGQSMDLQLLGATVAGRALAAALGIVTQIACAVGLLWLADRAAWSRRFFGLVAAAALIAAFLPPSSPVTAAEVGLALVCGVLAAVPSNVPRVLALTLIAGTAGTAPLADLRPVWLSTGRVQGPLAALEAVSGVAASAFAFLAFALFAAAVFALTRARTSPSPGVVGETSTTPSAEPATVPPP